MLWRKGSYGVCSHRGELFRQRILSLVETAKRLGRCPQEWLRAIVRACIEKTDYPIPSELCSLNRGFSMANFILFSAT